MLRKNLAICAVSFSLLSACSQVGTPTCTGGIDLVAEGVLTVAADYSYPPFAFRSADNDLIGFEVDVARAVAGRMKLEPKFVNRGSGQLISGALAHRHDLAASGLRPTANLRKTMCVSDGFLRADLGVLVRSPNPSEIDTVAALAGSKVGVASGTPAADWASDELRSSTLVELPALDDLLSGLRQKELDAAIVDHAFGRFTAKASGEFVLPVRIAQGTNFVFVAAPDRAGLIEGVNSALAGLRAAGKLGELERKWFGD